MMPAVLDMRQSYPYDDRGEYVEPGTRHKIDDDTGDLLEVTFTSEGWVASRHIAEPVNGESDELYWVLIKDSPVWMLPRCGPVRLPRLDDAHLDLTELVGEALLPTAIQQGSPIHSSVRIAMRPVEAEIRPSSRDRGHNLTDGIWQDVNGSSGSSMRATGGTFVIQVRAMEGLITFIRVAANPGYDGAALQKCLAQLSG